MTSRFDVTVIVPTYQGERYIEACMASIAAQDLEGVEVLVIDDCSTDATVAVVESFRDRIDDLRVLVNETNLGAVANVNRCVSEARGAWIKPVFQDDLIDPDCLTEMRAARQAGVPVVVCARRYLFEGPVPDFQREACDNLVGFALTSRLGSGTVPREQLAEVVAEQAADGLPHINLVGEPVVTLFERRAFRRAGGIDESYVQLWDYEMVLRLSMRRGLVLVDEPLASFRVHGGSETARNFSTQAFRINVLDRLSLHVAYARARRFRPVRRAALDLDPPPDLLAQAYGVFQAARRLAEQLPPEQRGQAHGSLDRISVLLPTPPPGPAGDVAQRAEEALFHEITSGPWMGLADQPMAVPELPSPEQSSPEVVVEPALAAEAPEPSVADPAPLEPEEGDPSAVGSNGPAVPDHESVPPARTPSQIRRRIGGLGKLARALRANQWWGHMLGPIVAFSALQIGWRQVEPSVGLARVLAVVMCSIALAPYGYVVNDAADVAEDRLAGKRNSMASLTLPQRIGVIGGFAVLGFLPWTVISLSDTALVVLACVYLMPLIYSVPPLRLKERHFLGPVADATNAFVLPALFTIALFAPHGDPSGPVFVMVLGTVLWTAAFGLRAIVKHQIDDAVNDRKSGASTWVLQVGEGQATRFMRNVAFPVELVGLGLLAATVWTWSWGTVVLALAAYAGFQALRVGDVLDRRTGTVPLAWGGWLYWQQIWPALVIGAALAVGNPWYLLFVGFVVVLFWPRVVSGLTHVARAVQGELRRARVRWRAAT